MKNTNFVWFPFTPLLLLQHWKHLQYVKSPCVIVNICYWTHITLLITYSNCHKEKNPKSNNSDYKVLLNLPNIFQGKDARMQDIRLLPQCSWGLHSSGMLCSIGPQLVTDVLGQPTCPILTLDHGTNKLPWNVSKSPANLHGITSQKSVERPQKILTTQPHDRPQTVLPAWAVKQNGLLLTFPLWKVIFSITAHCEHANNFCSTLLTNSLNAERKKGTH